MKKSSIIKDQGEAAFNAAKARLHTVESLANSSSQGRDILPVGKVEPGKISAVDTAEFDIKGIKPTDRFLGNEERFTAAYYSEPLTQYAVGWTDPEDLQGICDFIAPRVPVGRRFEYKLAVNAEAFLSEIDDERAIGAEFKQVEYAGSTTSSKTANRGLKYRIDLDEEGGGILTEELIVSRLLQRVRRNQLRRALLTLTGLSVTNTTAVVWTYNSSTNPNAQPNENLRSQAARAQADSGVYPNRLLMDLLSWNLRSATYAQQALSAGAITAYGMTIQQVCEQIGVDRGLMIKPVYQSLAATKSYLLGQKAIQFYSQDNPTRDDPTNLKHFVTPVGDGDFRVYRQPVGAKFVDITVEHYDNIVGTATVGINQLTVT